MSEGDAGGVGFKGVLAMTWTTDRPTQPGYYVFKHAACWPLYFVRIQQGSWQLAQNPEWLYCSGLPGLAYGDMQDGPLENIHGKWFGPIPEPAA
jgi:hypothetical protein